MAPECASAFHFAPEKSALNQYWYSDNTIAALAGASPSVLIKGMTTVISGEVTSLPHGQRAAMVSTPSIYFALDPSVREGHRVLDFDEQWKDDPGYTVLLCISKMWRDHLPLPSSMISTSQTTFQTSCTMPSTLSSLTLLSSQERCSCHPLECIF